MLFYKDNVQVTISPSLASRHLFFFYTSSIISSTWVEADVVLRSGTVLVESTHASCSTDTNWY